MSNKTIKQKSNIDKKHINQEGCKTGKFKQVYKNKRKQNSQTLIIVDKNCDGPLKKSATL